MHLNYLNNQAETLYILIKRCQKGEYKSKTMNEDEKLAMQYCKHRHFDMHTQRISTFTWRPNIITKATREFIIHALCKDYASRCLICDVADYFGNLDLPEKKLVQRSFQVFEWEEFRDDASRFIHCVSS